MEVARILRGVLDLIAAMAGTTRGDLAAHPRASLTVERGLCRSESESPSARRRRISRMCARRVDGEAGSMDPMRADLFDVPRHGASALQRGEAGDVCDPAGAHQIVDSLASSAGSGAAQSKGSTIHAVGRPTARQPAPHGDARRSKHLSRRQIARRFRLRGAPPTRAHPSTRLAKGGPRRASRALVGTWPTLRRDEPRHRGPAC